MDALFNVAGVSSGIGDPALVVRINFLGMRQFTETMLQRIPAGGSVTSVSSLAASEYRENASTTAGLVATASPEQGVQWCADHPDALAEGGGYRLAKEATILYTMSKVAELGARGIRINCTAPGSPKHPSSISCEPRTGRVISTRSPRRWDALRHRRSKPRCWCSSAAPPPVTSPDR